MVLCVGYLGELIVQEIGSERFGIRIRYSHDGPEPIGTLGAVRKAAGKRSPTPVIGISSIPCIPVAIPILDEKSPI